MGTNDQISNTLKKELLATMLKIRLAEEEIVEVYSKDQQMKTPTHLSIGQEAVSTGVCLALNKDDQVFASHRCHATYLAKGGELDPFFAELCGRACGANHGRGGSAHLSSPEHWMYSSPILGDMLAVAVGAAFSFQMSRDNRVAVAFMGDATIEEGVFAESLNFAILKKLPVLFICENNLYSTHTPLHDRQPPSPIFERISTPELKAQQYDGNEVELVYTKAKEALDECRLGNGPQFIEFLTYRYRAHVGPLYDHDKGYRTKKEVQGWQSKDPVRRYRQELIGQEVITVDEARQMEEFITEQVKESYARALQSPWPLAETLMENVY